MRRRDIPGLRATSHYRDCNFSAWPGPGAPRPMATGAPAGCRGHRSRWPCASPRVTTRWPRPVATSSRCGARGIRTTSPTAPTGTPSRRWRLTGCWLRWTGTPPDSPTRCSSCTSRRRSRWSASCRCRAATSCTSRWDWPACSASARHRRCPDTAFPGCPGSTSRARPRTRAAGCPATPAGRPPASCWPTGGPSRAPAPPPGGECAAPWLPGGAHDRRRRPGGWPGRPRRPPAAPGPGRPPRPDGHRVSAQLGGRTRRGHLVDRRARRHAVGTPRGALPWRADRCRRPAPGNRDGGDVRGGRPGHLLPLRPVRVRGLSRPHPAGRALPGPARLADDGLAQLGAGRAAHRHAARLPPGAPDRDGGGRLRGVGRRPRPPDGAGRLLDVGPPRAPPARDRHGAADEPRRGAAPRGRADDPPRTAPGPYRRSRLAANRRRRTPARARLDDPRRSARAGGMAGPAGLGGVGRRLEPAGPRGAVHAAPPGPAPMSSRLLRVLSGVSVAGALHAMLNVSLLRRPPVDPPPVRRRVTVVLPVRDEEQHVGACLATLLDQRGVADLRIVVVDDGSTDGTAAVVRAVEDPRVRLLSADTPPPGWLGKPHACAVGAAATGEDGAAADDVLVFVDADVRLFPDAVAGAVAVLEAQNLDLVSPWPRPLADTLPERLVQPLSPWLWATTLPLRLAERSPRPSLAAANGQFLVVTRRAYERAGGHSGVRGEVLEDVALLRAVKRCGGRGGPIDGSRLAPRRVDDGWPGLRDGYTKSLWAAVGNSPAAGLAAAAGLTAVSVLPVLAALRGSRAGVGGAAAGVAGRVASAAATGGRLWPDPLAHPLSVLLLDVLMVRSVIGRRRGTLTWRGRSLDRSGVPR